MVRYHLPVLRYRFLLFCSVFCKKSNRCRNIILRVHRIITNRTSLSSWVAPSKLLASLSFPRPLARSSSKNSHQSLLVRSMPQLRVLSERPQLSAPPEPSSHNLMSSKAFQSMANLYTVCPCVTHRGVWFNLFLLHRTTYTSVAVSVVSTRKKTSG
jgi:hypothetical protein